MPEELQIRIHGDSYKPTLIYLPGLHGDWSLVTGFRSALTGRARFVEITYPRSLTWNIEDYANAIEAALISRGITRGWLLGESFGSQLAWPLLGRACSTASTDSVSLDRLSFKPEGLILAGGFVKHPLKLGPALLRWIGEKTPMSVYRLELKFYAAYSKFRHRRSPENLDSVKEFVARRTDLDRQAMRQRLTLLDNYDPRPAARNTRVPVYYLAGLIDPLVPWMLVRRWLRKNCPGYRVGETFWLADHNVLATSPARAADLILTWMNR
ncbi:MAG: hypothetical protein JWR26_4741 [Pedosphaera sp.]|nr:hypothetical protein [Pedosphaera sp.]